MPFLTFEWGGSWRALEIQNSERRLCDYIIWEFLLLFVNCPTWKVPRGGLQINFPVAYYPTIYNPDNVLRGKALCSLDQKVTHCCAKFGPWRPSRPPFSTLYAVHKVIWNTKKCVNIPETRFREQGFLGPFCSLNRDY